jgi:hypothetical protein
MIRLTARRASETRRSTGVSWIGKNRISASGEGSGTTLPMRSSSVSDVRSSGTGIAKFSAFQAGSSVRVCES